MRRFQEVRTERAHIALRVLLESFRGPPRVPAPRFGNPAAQIKQRVQQGHAAPREPLRQHCRIFLQWAARRHSALARGGGSRRNGPALGPGRARCHRGIADSAFGRCSGRKAKKRSQWEHFCPDCWRTYQLNIPPKALTRMRGTQCWVPAQVNVRASFRMVNDKRSTARQGRSPLYLTWDAVILTQAALLGPRSFLSRNEVLSWLHSDAQVV